MTETKPGRQIKTAKCPYMPQHIMPQDSLLNHLSRCSATNKHLFTKCKYNPIHVYPNDQIEIHYRKCKDKKKWAKHQESSDDWGAESDNQKEKNAQLQNKKEETKGPKEDNKKLSQSSLVADQSAISLKTDPGSSQEWAKMSSDQSGADDYEQTQHKIQSMSINSNKPKNEEKPQSSFQSFTESEAPQWQKSSHNDSKHDFKEEKQNQSKSRQMKKDSSLNQSDRFHQQSEPEEKNIVNKKANKTLNSVSESQKSRDNGIKKKEKIKKPSKVEEEDDVEVEDF